MSYTFEKLEKSQVKFNFEVSKDEFEVAVQKAYEQTKHKYAIPGFRKGHAPRKVIEGAYGKGVFYDEALNIVIDEEYGKAMEAEKELEVVANPEQLDAMDFTEDGGVTFSVTVTVRPEVKLGQYKGLSVEKKVEKVTAKDIDAEIEKAQEQQARFIDVDGEAKDGQTVTIDFVGSVDGVKFDGGAGENYDLVLGSGTFIPGFEEQLIGTKAGDQKDVKVTFPEDYQAKELAGKEAVFACTVKAVKTKELPAIDDEFVKEISEFDTLAEYKADIKAKLEKEKEDAADRKWMDDVLRQIVENSEFEVPEAMIKLEAEDMVKDFEYRLMYQGMKLDDYLGYLKMTREQLVDQYKDQAKETVATRLVVSDIIQAEKIEIKSEEIEIKIAEMAKDYNQSTDDFKKGLKKEQMDYIVNAILSDKFAEFIKNANSADAAKKAPAKKAAKKEEAPAEAKAEEKKPAAKKKAPAKKAE